MRAACSAFIAAAAAASLAAQNRWELASDALRAEVAFADGGFAVSRLVSPSGTVWVAPEHPAPLFQLAVRFERQAKGRTAPTRRLFTPFWRSATTRSMVPPAGSCAQ